MLYIGKEKNIKNKIKRGDQKRKKEKIQFNRLNIINNAYTFKK